MRWLLRLWWTSAWGCLLVHVVHANNLRITSVTCDKHFLHASIAWDHGWNLTTAPANHDAVWLFAKLRTQGGAWQHVPFSLNAADHGCSNPSRLALEPGERGEGIMVKNIGPGAGDIASTEIHLAWQSPLPSGLYELRLHGIEMAWVAEDPFWLGDGASNFALHDSTNGQPYFITSEGAIPAAALAAEGGKGTGGALSDAYPKGFRGFYLMKYELSQAQYVDFLNTLTYAQQQQRTTTDPDAPEGTLAMTPNLAHRNGIVVEKRGIAPTSPAVYACNLDGGAPNGDLDGQTRACNWLSWPDLAAYLDWAALRPITELEFEKACRGPLSPIALEFAWGTDSIVDANTPIHDGSAAETVTEVATAMAGLGSHGYTGPQGPLRCGFGATGNGNRLQAGAGYYGHLELSGNLWELCVSTRATGLGFDGAHGDGSLSHDGGANVPSWPGPEGIGYRGGAWNSGILPSFRDLTVSDRFYIDWLTDLRRNTTGGRGAR